MTGINRIGLGLGAGIVLLAGGCSLTDPYQRPGSWRPLGVNDANLAVMVVNKSDLQQGTPGGLADGQLAAAAVERLRHDRVKPLGDSGVADLKPNATVGAAQAPAGGSN